jgi:hypothetical protein
MMLTKDCQLSSMIKFVMLISFLDSDSSASNSFCSVRCCPIPFQVQYDSPSSVLVSRPWLSMRYGTYTSSPTILA